MRPTAPQPLSTGEAPFTDIRARGRVGRICCWLTSHGDDGRPNEFMFSVDAEGDLHPVEGYFAISLEGRHAELLVRLVRTAAEHGWLVCAAGRPRPGSRVYDVFDLYTEF